MNKRKWTEINNLGILYIENILITFDIPLLFVCSNEFDQRFLTLCLDEETEKYLLTPIYNQDLIKMMEDKITMRDAFLLYKKDNRLLLNWNKKEKRFDTKEICIKDLSDDMLPDEGIFYKVHNKKNDNYISDLTKTSKKSPTSYR